MNEEIEQQTEDISEAETKKPLSVRAWIITAVIVGLLAIIGIVWIAGKRSSVDKETTKAKVEPATKESNKAPEVKLDAETLESANLEYETVTQRPAVALLNVTGTVEANPEQTQQVSLLVAGRIEEVFVSIGDRVSAGQPLATIMSTEVVESHGKLREAQTRMELAQKNLARIRRAENQVNVLQSKAKLDEAEATLKRTRRLIELGAGAGKDLIAAETVYKTAKADYDFQRNISLNRETQEAVAALQTAQSETLQLRQRLEALGANVGNGKTSVRNVGLVPLRAPLSGMVTERLAAPGSGIQAGQAVFTLSNISSVWITANVPEQQMSHIRIGTAAEIQSAALGVKLNARVTYIDPQINEDTRTARVRLAIGNPGERLRTGMFVEVGFHTSTGAATGQELVVPTAAIQRVGEKDVVFIPKENEPGTFEMREVETAGEVEGYTRITAGLEIGEKVVTKGSFTLKTQLQKGEMVEED